MTAPMGPGTTVKAWGRHRQGLNLIIIQEQITPTQGLDTASLTPTPDLRAPGLVSLVEPDLVEAASAVVDSGLEWAQVEFWDICLGIRDGSHRWASQDQLITATLLQLLKQAQEHGPPQVLEPLKEDDCREMSVYRHNFRSLIGCDRQAMYNCFQMLFIHNYYVSPDVVWY